MKKTQVILIVLVALVFCIVALPWALIYIGLLLQPDPPRPEITYGEFPFKLVYEINGERKVIQDTVICEYDGVGMDEGQGKHRKWKQRYVSGNKNITLLKINNNSEIVYSEGSANYYMGDLKEYEQYNPLFPDAIIIEKDIGSTSEGLIRADELLKKYHIKLISWEPSPPIKNTFIESAK